METNRTSYIKKYDKILIYITVYTIVFFLFVKTLPYTIPFVLAFAIAAIVSPIVKKLILWTREKVNENLLILITLLSFYGLLGTLIVSLIIRLVNQSILLVTNSITYLNDNYDSIASWIQAQYEWIASNIQELDPSILKQAARCLPVHWLLCRKL